MADGKVTIDVILKDGSVAKGIANLANLEKGSQKAGISIKSLATSMGLIKVASAAFNVVKNSLDSAISRFDTMQKFPKVMKALGFSAEDSQKSINKLSDGIDGLPTKLDDVVSSTQQMTAITGDLDKSTDTVLALNNAFLASGASTEDASRGMQQYNQMLSTGTVDLESWKTLQETMPLALQKTAEAMGYTGKSAQRDLYNALKEGTVTFDQFQDKLIELGTGTGMLASLAKENSLGIATSFGNLGNAVSKNLANIITKFDEIIQKISGKTIAQHIDGLKTIINSAGESIVKAMDKIIPLIEKVTSIVNEHAMAFNILSGVIVSVIAALTALKVLSTVAGTISTVVVAVKSLATAISMIKSFAGALALVKYGFATLSAAVGGPVVLIGAAIAGLAAGFLYFYNTNETFKNGINQTIEIVKSGLIKAFEFLKSAFNSILPTFQNVISKIESFKPVLSQIGTIISGAFSTGIEVAGNLLEKLGGSFGKIGGVISIVVSVLTKVAIAALGLTGPMGLVISLVVSFIAALVKTGDFSSSGITKVFDQLSETISNFSDKITAYLPAIINAITIIITGIVDKIIQNQSLS